MAESLEEQCKDLLSALKGEKVLRGFSKKVRTGRNIGRADDFRTAIEEFRIYLNEAFFCQFYPLMPHNLPEEVSRKIFEFTQRGLPMFNPRYLSDVKNSKEIMLNEQLRRKLLRANDSCRSILRHRLSRSLNVEDLVENYHNVIVSTKKSFKSFKMFCGDLWPDPVKLEVALWPDMSERVSFQFSSYMDQLFK